MSRKRLLYVVGARPNFMKVAPIMRQCAQFPEDFEQVLVHTGQHYDSAMSDVFFTELGLPEPNINLGVGSGSHARQTAEVMIRFEPVLLEHRPDFMIVPGDVNSTLACSLVASKAGVSIVHVEAGLRSYDRSMPEEINRVLTDQLSDVLLTHSEGSMDNLIREGVEPGKIFFVGNVMIDTVVRLLPKAEERWADLRERFKLNEYLLVTLHRPVNVDADENLGIFLEALADISTVIPVIFPVHPRTRDRIGHSHYELDANSRIRLIEPLGYLDFLALQAHARAVLTDSGGVQEETTYLGVPCLTARPNTERPITLTAGTNRLVRTERDDLKEAVRTAVAYSAPRRSAAPPPLWDGRAAERIVALLRNTSANGLIGASSTRVATIQ